MNHCRPARGVLQQSDSREVNADSGGATVPQPRRPETSVYRHIPGAIPVRSGPATASTIALNTSQPVRREREPGGTAMDAIEPEVADRQSWRNLVHRYAGIDLGPGRDAAYETALRAQISTPVDGAYPIAVLNLKGGVGKTTVVEALGSTFASVRGDRVIAVDADEGDLSDRHGRRSQLSLADLVLDGSITRYADVRAHTFMNSSGLEVLGPPDYAQSYWSIRRQDFVKTYSLLRNHYSLMLVDCPKTLKSGVMEAVLSESRALVVVTRTSIDAIQKTRTTLEWLSNNGYRKLLKSTVLTVNHVERTQLSTLAAKELEQLSAQVDATVVLPFDRHVHQGCEIGLDRMSRESKRCYLEMAAALARRFHRR